MTASTTHLSVDVDFGQYYGYGVGADFDESSVDAAMDGIAAPGEGGVRFLCLTQSGRVDVSVVVVDEEIVLPPPPGRVASAFNLHLPTGVFALRDWGGPTVFRHDFGRALRCGIMVEVEQRDEAWLHRDAIRRRAAGVSSDPDEPTLFEHHTISISPFPFAIERWRTAAMDNGGKYLTIYTEHIDAPLR